MHKTLTKLRLAFRDMHSQITTHLKRAVFKNILKTNEVKFHQFNSNTPMQLI